ncbi:MAG: methyltransferase type 11, partial [Methylobacteriaceae bacterium]|nr:methyltransferase type 11 [Methylobacteriaceae bacterium]
LVCCDAAAPWPVADRFDLVLCQDAFYFLEPKPEILRRLRERADGALLVGHIHNSEAPNFSAGRAVDAATLARLFPDGIVYDDSALTRAAALGRLATPDALDRLRRVEAFAVAAGPGLAGARPSPGLLTVPRPDRSLRRNPLYGPEAAIRWPSERYRSEYAPLATYPERSDLPEALPPGAWLPEAARRRELVDLPERW